MSLASAYKGLGQAKQKKARVEKNWEIAGSLWDNAQDLAGAYAGAKASADAEWDSYEQGYEDVTGETYNPETRERGLFKDLKGAPTGEVRIGDKLYQAEDISKYGDLKRTISEDTTGIYSMPTPDGKSTYGEKMLEKQKSGIDFKWSAEDLTSPLNTMDSKSISFGRSNEGMVFKGGDATMFKGGNQSEYDKILSEGWSPTEDAVSTFISRPNAVDKNLDANTKNRIANVSDPFQKKLSALQAHEADLELQQHKKQQEQNNNVSKYNGKEYDLKNKLPKPNIMQMLEFNRQRTEIMKNKQFDKGLKNYGFKFDTPETFPMMDFNEGDLEDIG